MLPMNRRTFVAHAAVASGAVALGAAWQPPKRIRVGVIGCGSVSGRYLPHLRDCPHAEVVSVCDIRPERAAHRAREFAIANQYSHIDALLAGVPFDLLVNLTDMQEHERLNRQAIQAGKHVWSEKPMANSLAAGQELLALARSRGVHFWGAPVVVNSPQFAFMARTAHDGTLGRIAAAHAVYGHTGPHWSSFFYEKGGGSMPDLGVYNFTTLTGLLGPARSVAAMTSIITPSRRIDEKGDIRVVAEDNAMVLMEHASGVLSHVMCGFNYFDPHGHEAAGATRPTISVIGSKGSMRLIGYDWEPKGVEVATEDAPEPARRCPDAGAYVWQEGASHMAECLATGLSPRVTPEHALHVLEIIEAARASQETGRRIPLTSTFRWPVPA
jgi:predicted dehydrogenase